MGTEESLSSDFAQSRFSCMVTSRPNNWLGRTGPPGIFSTVETPHSFFGRSHLVHGDHTPKQLAWKHWTTGAKSLENFRMTCICFLWVKEDHSHGCLLHPCCQKTGNVCKLTTHTMYKHKVPKQSNALFLAICALQQAARLI